MLTSLQDQVAFQNHWIPNIQDLELYSAEPSSRPRKEVEKAFSSSSLPSLSYFDSQMKQQWQESSSLGEKSKSNTKSFYLIYTGLLTREQFNNDVKQVNPPLYPSFEVEGPREAFELASALQELDLSPGYQSIPPAGYVCKLW